MSPTDPLTIQDVIALAEVVESQGEKVRFLSQNGEVISGTSRHIVRSPYDGYLLRADDDIRDGYLRITLASGLDTALPVTAVARLVRRGEFAIDR